MKRLTLQIVILLFISTTLLYGQDSLKTSAGRWTTELNINPLQGQISLNNAINQIKVRYFITNQTSLRFAFSLNNIKKDGSSISQYGISPVNNSFTQKSTSFGLNFGFEKHLTGTHRLSPYIGAEIAFGLKNSNETIETLQSTTEIKGGWQTYQTTLSYYPNSGYGNLTVASNTELGYTSMGINLITGFDYYIAKHLFVGYELLFGYNYIKYADIEINITSKPRETITNNANPTQSSQESNFGAKIVNGIRFGYTF